MQPKYLFFSFAAAALVFLCSSTVVSAQSAQLFGKVSVKQANGTVVSGDSAKIEVYRIDAPGHWKSTANKRGEFVFAGLPVAGIYIVAACARGATPDLKVGVKVGGDDNVIFTLEPGNSDCLTAADVKARVGKE